MLWLFEPLNFESGVFDAPVGRVSFVPDEGEPLKSLVRSWLENGQWLVSARIDAHDVSAAEDLCDAGFELIETLITLEVSLPEAMDRPDGIALAVDADREQCLAIASSAFVYDRFHADSRVPKNAADHLKRTWVANALNGRADAVLVAHGDKGEAIGFVTCMTQGDAAVIDLIAVDSGCQGHGIGKRLVKGACAHYAGRKNVMRVGTQQNNSVSIALYKKHGFSSVKMQYTYHWVPSSSLSAGGKR